MRTLHYDSLHRMKHSSFIQCAERDVYLLRSGFSLLLEGVTWTTDKADSSTRWH